MPRVIKTLYLNDRYKKNDDFNGVWSRITLVLGYFRHYTVINVKYSYYANIS